MSPLEPWPALPFETWRDTLATLHRCAQIVGKIRMAQTPLVNHHWNVALRLTPRGLSTGATPCPPGDGAGEPDRSFSIELDLVDHQAVVRTSDGATRAVPLLPRPVADFYAELFAVLEALGMEIAINDHPVELLTEALPLSTDRLHAAYDPEAVARWFTILRRSAEILEEFRAGFLGKCSPVHFFWGSFDLAVTRFSGRAAPAREGADPITREAYSHEVSSVGFWPGDLRFPEPACYAYANPIPDGYDLAPVLPAEAFWHGDLREFLLPYEALRQARDPRDTLLAFAESTYAAAADLARWDRAALERPGVAYRPATPPSTETPDAQWTDEPLDAAPPDPAS